MLSYILLSLLLYWFKLRSHLRAFKLWARRNSRSLGIRNAEFGNAIVLVLYFSIDSLLYSQIYILAYVCMCVCLGICNWGMYFFLNKVGIFVVVYCCLLNMNSIFSLYFHFADLIQRKCRISCIYFLFRLHSFTCICILQSNYLSFFAHLKF